MPTQAQKNDIAGLYAGYFDRAPDPAGLQFWYDQIDAGRELATIAADFAKSAEATALYPFLSAPGVASPSTFVTAVYQNLFNRAPDAAGLKFWTDVITAKTVSVGDMIQSIIKGAVDTPAVAAKAAVAATATTPAVPAVAAAPATNDATTMANKAAVGLDFAAKATATSGFTYDANAAAAAKAALDGVTDVAATVTAAKAEIDAFLGGSNVSGSTTAFTTAVGENLVGTAGNDTFTATVDAAGLGATPAATLNTGDTVDGAGGTDTINISSTSPGSFVPAAGTTTNIEIVNLIADTAGDSFAGSGAFFSAGNFAGVTSLNQIGGAGPLAVSGVTDATTIGFASAPVADVQMATGGTTANIALTNVTTAGTINIGETTAGTLTTATVNGSVAGAGATLAINMDAAPAPGGVAASAETVLNLGLTSATAVTLTSATNKTIDGSASTGALTVTGVATTETLKGGSGGDTLTGGAASKLIEGGAGSDTIASGAAVGNVIDGGANGTGAVKFDAITLAAGSQTVLTKAGESGITFATADQITAFATTSDKLDFNLAAGSGTNFLDGGVSSSFTDGLTNANTAMNGTVQYFATNDAANTYLFVDSNLDGTADFAVSLMGVGPAAVVFGDIIA